jgi:hypothetical protein
MDRIHGSDETKTEKLRAETELELARIHRDESIQLAKISQKMNENDNEAELVAAETAAEVQADVIDSLSPEPEVAEPETVVVFDQADEPEPADEASELDLPEESEVAEPSEPKSSGGYGASWAFGR